MDSLDRERKGATAPAGCLCFLSHATTGTPGELQCEWWDSREPKPGCSPAALNPAALFWAGGAESPYRHWNRGGGATLTGQPPREECSPLKPSQSSPVPAGSQGIRQASDSGWFKDPLMWSIQITNEVTRTPRWGCSPECAGHIVRVR